MFVTAVSQNELLPHHALPLLVDPCCCEDGRAQDTASLVVQVPTSPQYQMLFKNFNGEEEWKQITSLPDCK
jgi:hypothetical protein